MELAVLKLLNRVCIESARIPDKAYVQARSPTRMDQKVVCTRNRVELA